MPVIDKLTKIISQPPLHVQVSIKGIWEDTWDIPFQAGMPATEAIEHYVAKGTDGLAFEVFFKTDDGYAVMVGIRFAEGLAVATPREFLVTSFQTIWSTMPPTFAGIVAQLSKKLTHDPHALGGINPTGIELGVMKWWQSLGNLEIWNSSNDKTFYRETLKQQLEHHTHLVENTKNYVLMELNYRVTPHHWIGIQVSDKQGAVWVLNEPRLEMLLKDLLHISPH